MAIGNGRGDENKERIRREWDLVPVMHTRLLNGQSIKCCCEVGVTTTYYRFDGTHRISGKHDVLFAHAQGCARKLMGIAPTIAPIPLFNPLQAAPMAHGARGGGGGGDGTRMHPFNRELYEAIHLLLMCWGRPPASGGPLVDILDEYPPRAGCGTASLEGKIGQFGRREGAADADSNAAVTTASESANACVRLSLDA